MMYYTFEVHITPVIVLPNDQRWCSNREEQSFYIVKTFSPWCSAWPPEWIISKIPDVCIAVVKRLDIANCFCSICECCENSGASIRWNLEDVALISIRLVSLYILQVKWMNVLCCFYSDEYRRTSLMIQHWFWEWLYAVKQQDIF